MVALPEKERTTGTPCPVCKQATLTYNPEAGRYTCHNPACYFNEDDDAQWKLRHWGE